LSYGGRHALSKVIPLFREDHTTDYATPPRATFKHSPRCSNFISLYCPYIIVIRSPTGGRQGLEIWREITSEYNGGAIKGSFKFLDGVVTVRTLNGSKAAQVRGQTPEQLAKALPRELARDGMA